MITEKNNKEIHRELQDARKVLLGEEEDWRVSKTMFMVVKGKESSLRRKVNPRVPKWIRWFGGGEQCSFEERQNQEEDVSTTK